MSDRISYDVIVAAKNGDSIAMTAILRHYAPYIAAHSRRRFYDEYNNSYEFIDEEIRQRIEAKLMIQIFYKFDPTRMPVSSE